MSDRDIIRDMLDRAGIKYSIGQSSDIETGSSTFKFTSLGALMNTADAEPDWDDCPNCGDYESHADSLHSTIVDIKELADGGEDVKSLKAAKAIIGKIYDTAVGAL